MNKLFAYILAGILFSFPFLSPSVGSKTVPSFQFGYLVKLQAGEDKNKSGGSDDGKEKLNEPRTNVRVSKAERTAGKVHLKSLRSANEKVWSCMSTADDVRRNQRAMTYERAASHPKFNSLLSIRTVVLRI